MKSLGKIENVEVFLTRHDFDGTVVSAVRVEHPNGVDTVSFERLTELARHWDSRQQMICFEPLVTWADVRELVLRIQGFG